MRLLVALLYDVSSARHLFLGYLKYEVSDFVCFCLELRNGDEACGTRGYTPL